MIEKKAARSLTQTSPHPERLKSPLGSTLVISSNGNEDGNGPIQSPTCSVESLAMVEKQTQRQQLKLIFPTASEAVLDRMLAQSAAMSIPSAEEKEENFIDKPSYSQGEM